MGSRPRRARLADSPPPRSRDGAIGGEQVEGRRAVAALLGSRRHVREVWLAEGQGTDRVLADIGRQAARRRVPVRVVSRDRLQAIATTMAPQGVVARAAPPAETDLDELLGGTGRNGEPPFLLAVEGVTDPQNLGALLRSAEVAGVTGVLLGRARGVRVTPTVAKAAAGAIETLRFALVAGIPAALARARERALWTVGLAADGDEPLFGLALADQPLVVVVGAEGQGLSRLARARCDVVARIPMEGQVRSLNVAVAGALGLFEVRRRRVAGTKASLPPIDTPSPPG